MKINKRELISDLLDYKENQGREMREIFEANIKLGFNPINIARADRMYPFYEISDDSRKYINDEKFLTEYDRVMNEFYSMQNELAKLESRVRKITKEVNK